MRFGYDGAGFAGWARQPGLRTVEGEIHGGLARLGIAEPGTGGQPEVASRTDRGVSARGNALAISSPLAAGPLLRALNGIASDIFFTHAREVTEAFRPRRALARWYRYFEPADGRDPATWRAAAAQLVGRIDVRSFGRGLVGTHPVWRDVGSIEVRPSGRWLEIDLRAPSFVWGMVRKIVAALRAVEAGELTLRDLTRAARGELRLTLPLAAPEGLVLWEVLYAEPWGPTPWRPTRHQRERALRALAAARVREQVLDGLWERPGSPAPG